MKHVKLGTKHRNSLPSLDSSMFIKKVSKGKRKISSIERNTIALPSLNFSMDASDPYEINMNSVSVLNSEEDIFNRTWIENLQKNYEKEQRR